MTVSFQNISKSISLMPLAFFHRKIAIFYVFQLAVEIGACMRSWKALWIGQTSSLVFHQNRMCKFEAILQSGKANFSMEIKKIAQDFLTRLLEQDDRIDLIDFNPKLKSRVCSHSHWTLTRWRHFDDLHDVGFCT